MSDYIPMEILWEVIKRLPVKLLVQYRSISKSWKCLIDSSEFIAGYGVRQTQPKRLLLWHADPIFPKKRCSLVDDETLVQQEIISTFPVLSKLLRLSHVVGSSRGVLCLYGNYHIRTSVIVVAVLWNPSIRKSVGIHVPGIFPLSYPYTHLGFGVCPITSDPIIVKIDKCRHGAFKAWVVEVFTLSTGSWRILSKNPPSSSIIFGWAQVATDRFIYWLASDKMSAIHGRSSIKNLIISFDMTTHEFTTIDIPDDLACRSSRILSISKVSEALVLLEYDVRMGRRVCDVWIMDDGVPTSFTKLVTISEQGGFFRYICEFTPRGEPRFHKSYIPNLCTSSTFVYKPCSQHINDLRIIAYDLSFYVESYMESLLLIDQSDCSFYFENSVVPMDCSSWINLLPRHVTLKKPPRRFHISSLLRKLCKFF